ncbi:MAG: cell envelope integrity protein CreD [Bacteroidales bacterium]|nr:cell envelope integrity protein CreD [Bacteroidales bacterium]MDD4210440.1 cell envelope integrity protein CreD [Bacteroidales bacterium]
MNTLKNNIYIKLLIIISIVLLLLIPTTMIKGLIHERENVQNDAISEVSAKWGENQTISGPYISIPYYKYVKEYSKKDSVEKLVLIKENIHILPSELSIDGIINPESRYRGIYEIVVYNSVLHIKGTFNLSDMSELDIAKENIQFDKAYLSLGISDLRGIEKQINLSWNNQMYSFNPGVVSDDIIVSGINANIDLDSKDSMLYEFSLSIDLKGSQLLYFTPVGKVTDIRMASSWSNPSFNGSFLPDTREVSDTGFVAGWNVLHLNRNYPQMWTGSNYSVESSSFGIDLLLPVDSYQKSYRSIRYAILFIAFTFITFFFIEVLNKVFIHPVQYVLVGIALVVFYTLLLSISEYLNYNVAFIISAMATILLIAGYLKAILKSNKLTLLISAILFILYAFIFVIIQLQDFSLLIGSVGLFVILGLIMFYSRKIDWYNLNLKEEKKE